MNRVILYQNAQQKLFTSAKDEAEAIKKVLFYYKNKNQSLDDVSKNYSIRIYFVKIIKHEQAHKEAIIKSLTSKGSPIDTSKAVIWTFKGTYKDINILIKAIDTKDITYHIWEVLEYFLNKENKDLIQDLDFTLHVKPKKQNNHYTEKQKLILFFSKKENCNKLWTYEDARIAMQKALLSMKGRGIEGERPREFRYDLGYPFITSEQNKNVPDGSFRVDFPFPNQQRNERRNINITLIKKDWSELFVILSKDSTRLRCFECGLFEEEINKIGQKTKFEKGHLINHLSGGIIAENNITSICKHCNSKQKDIYSYNLETGKKFFHLIPFLKNKNYNEKIKALKYLLQSMKKKDIEQLQKTLFQ